MHTKFLRAALAGILLIAASQACALLPTSGGVDEAATELAATVSAMQSTVSALQTLETTPSAIFPSETPIASSTSAPYQYPNSTVIHDALCWLGPGPGYEVSSALLKGTRVRLLGSTTLGGWWVISDPIYYDPCWMYQDDLQLDPGVSPDNMQVFSPPPTATPTPTDTPTSAPTSTATPTATP
jgi:hypothetical protein